jgi:hypothetical protein
VQAAARSGALIEQSAGGYMPPNSAVKLYSGQMPIAPSYIIFSAT